MLALASAEVPPPPAAAAAAVVVLAAAAGAAPPASLDGALLAGLGSFLFRRGPRGASAGALLLPLLLSLLLCLDCDFDGGAALVVEGSIAGGPAAGAAGSWCGAGSASSEIGTKSSSKRSSGGRVCANSPSLIEDVG
jgi:hypothetical protein